MIKEQCNNCKKNQSSICTHSIVYNGMSCPDYTSKFDLSKSTEELDVNSTNNSSVNQENNTKHLSNSSGFSVSSIFSFRGRIRRTAYWLISFALNLLLLPINMSGENVSDGVVIYTLLILIPVLWICLASAAKRSHDLGKSGWSVILLFIPIINLILGIYLAFFKGEECDNQYGPNPY